MRKLTEEKLLAEQERLEKMKEYEYAYEDHVLVCGIDEVGRGPLAGPVVAGAVILPRDCQILYLNDSKKLSEKKREALFLEIKEKAVAYAVGVIGAEKVDEINILQATYEAMRLAVSKLGTQPQVLLNDAVTIPSLASVLAKVTRDHMMEEYDTLFPQYGFAKHKGYGTAAHISALKEYGPCPIHRRSFIKNFTD